MRSISIISKLTGVTNNVEASEITLSSPSIVELKAERSDIASILRTNNDMIITLHDGEVITVKNFYAFADQGGNQLVLEDDHGALWWVQDTDSAFHFEHINNIDELMAATGAENHGGAAIWPWVLGGVAVAGGIALAAGGGGGGGGGGDNDNGNSNGGPGNPNPPPPANDVTPPDAPTNLSISADGKTLTGNSEPGSTVTITDSNGQVIGTGTAGSDGSFTIPLTTPQISGEELTAHATDPSGNTGPDGTVIAPNIPLPDAPTLTSVVDDVAPVTGTVPNNAPLAPTNDNTPTLQGTGQAGTTIHIYDNGQEIGTTVVAANGSWSFTPTTALADGSHSFSVTTINAKGESEPSGSYTITIDTVAPEAPELAQLQDNVGKITGVISNAMPTDENQPGIHGKGEPGDKVTIFDNGVQITQVTVDGNGEWTFTPSQPLAEGPHTITLIQTDAAGNISNTTTSPMFTVDRTPPPVPTDLRVSDDGLHVTGTAEAGSIITVTDGNGVVLGTGTADINGAFDVNPLTTAQTNGETLEVTATDKAGNTGPEAPVDAPDSTPPDAPVILNADDNVGDLQQPVLSGGITDDTTPTFHGTGVDGDIIKLYNGSTLLGTTTVVGGVWSITPTPALPNGPVNLTATATDAVGNVSDPSANFALTIYTTPLTEPVVTGIVDDVGAIQTPLTTGSVTDDKMPTFNGTGTAGSTINIYDNGGTTPIGTTVVAQDGSWSITLPELSETQHSLTIGATDPAGNSVGPSAPIVITVDNTPPPAPQITQPVEITGTTVSGTAEPGSTVIIKDAGNQEIGRGTADSSTGAFTVNISPAQTAGGTLTAVAQDPAGNTSDSTSFTASNSGLPQPPVITLLVDDVNPVSGNVTSGQSTNDTLPEVHGTAAPGAIVNLYLDGNLVPGIIVADGSGNWTYPSLLPLLDGPHTYTATQTVLGETSGFTVNFTVTIDTAAPGAPAITGVVDDVTPGIGELTNNQTTNDPRPTIHGTGEAGTTVTIFDNNNPLGTALVGTDGTWTFTPVSNLLDGEHIFTAQATDLAGNVGGVSTIFTIDIDATAPAAPVITGAVDNNDTLQVPVLSGQSTNDTTPILSGTTEPDSIITISDNGTVIGTIQVDGTGIWSYTPTALGEGSHSFTVTATDAVGNVSTVSNTYTVIVDTTPPAAPTGLLVTTDGLHVTGTAEAGSIITVTDGNGVVLGTGTADINGVFDVNPLTTAQTNGEALLVSATDAAGNKGPNTGVLAQDNTDPLAPTDLVVNDDGTIVTGNAEPGSTVTVNDSNGNPLGNGQAGDDGSFSVTITPAQTNGETLEVTATDKAGNTGPEAPVDAPDSTPPVVPVIDSVIDDVANITGNLNNGDITNDNKPTLQGTAEPGATINIYDNSGTTPIGTVTADAGGIWSFTPTTELGQGLHNLTVTATDADGNTSPASSFTLTVDSIAPQAPAITLISDDQSPITGAVPNNGFTNDATPTISGTGEPGSLLTLFDGATELTTLTVSPSGTWSYTPSTLSESTHHFTVSASDPTGNTSAPSAEYVITVDTTLPAAPTIDTVDDDIGSITATLANNSVTDDTRPQFNGSGPAGSTVTLYDGATAIGSIVVGGDGKWTIIPAQPLAEGPHALSAVATDAAGNASPAASFNLTVDTTPPAAPAITSAQGEIAGSSAPIVNGGSTQNGTPVLSGSGEPGATIKIYDNGGSTPIGSVTVPAGGTWTFTPTTPLSEGSHTLTAVATDPAGNVGLPSAGFTLTVDSTLPTTPGIPVVTDDQAPVLGNISNGGSTNDTTPTISGTGSVGDTITIRDNGSDIGTTTVRADGSWSFTPQTPISGVNHSISVIESDAAGNKSLPSGSVAFTLDTTASAAPTIVSADDNVGPVQASLSTGGVTDDNTPTFHGTGVNGDTITLYSGSTVIGSATVSGGTWVITATSLPDGVKHITATATDAAGNISAPSADFTLTVYTTPIAAPVVTGIVDNVGTIQTPLVNGSYTDDRTPTFNGTGTAGSTVSIYDNGGTTAIGTAIVGTDGTWTFTPATALPAGVSDHTFTFSATDAVGNTVASTNTILLHIDTVAPLAPIVLVPGDTVVSGTAEAGSTVIIRNAGGVEIGRGLADGPGGAFIVTISPAQATGAALTAIAQDLAGNQSTGTTFFAVTSNALQPPTIEVWDDVTPNTGNLTSGQSTNDNLPTLSGLAGSNADVTVYIDGIEQPPVTADASGVWTYQFTTPLSEGQHTFAVLQNIGSLFSGKSPNFVITVDTILPTQPTITTVTDDVAPITGTVNSGQATNDPRPTITGTGEIGSTITILDNGTSIGTAVVGTGGTWTFTPTSDLGQGLHPITVTSTDAAGNVSAPSAGFSVNVDTLTTAPVISSVTDNVGTPAPVISGVPTNDNTPTFTGTAEANSTITISENGNVIGTALVDGTGNWNFTPNPALTDGSHNLTIITTDTAGNVSPATTFNAVIDTTAPIVPAITLVVDDQTQVGNVTLTSGQSTKDTLPTLSGTSEANAVITLKDGNTIIGTTTANGNGEWLLDPTTALGQGSHSLTVTATDAAGNISNPSSAFTVVVDSVAPTAPLIVTVTDNTAPNIGPITSGQPTNETRPAITGSGEVGSTIKIYDGSNPTPLGTATVGAGGTWSFTPPTALSSGSHNLTVTATDAAGNVSAPSAIFNVVVDLAAPGTPAITNIADDVGSAIGNLTNNQVTDDTRPALSGTAEAGSTVNIYDNGTLIGTTTATGGVWNFTPPANAVLGNGNHAFTVTATDAAGNVSPPSAAFNIVVDITAPTAPIVIQAFDDVGPVTGPLVSGQTTNDKQPLLSGTAEANSTVNIYDNGGTTPIGTVTALPNGTWSFTPSGDLGEGTHVFTATSTDAAGNLGAVSGTFTLVIDSIAPNTPVLTSVVDDIAGGVFNNPLGNGQVTNDARPTIGGTGEVGTTITILDGGTPIGTVTVPAGGSWTFTPTTPLTAGLHTITLTATDAAGNVSGPTAGFAITVDTTAPTTPVISSIVDDVAGGVVNNALGSGQVTNDNRPTLNGTAEAGSTVTIYDNGALYTTVIADGSGNWTYTSPTAVLAEGSHTFTVTATDVAGNISTTSLPSVIVVDITPPAAPTDMTVNGTGTIVTGNAEAGSLVTITGSGGVVLGTATADGTGKFSASISPAQTNSQALIAFAQDVAGNVGVSAGFSAPNTALPGVPVITSIFDNAAPVTGGVANGQSTNDATPTINGTADVGATVSIYNNGQLMGTVVATNGTWSYTPGTLTDGSHAFTATATNINGTGSPSTAITVTVDTIAPLTPTATISADGTTISGTAEANSTVNITLPGGTVITTTANGSGAYSLTLPTREISGEQLSVTASDAVGNTSPAVTAIAPTLQLVANDNVIDLALSSTATVSPPVHYNDYGVLLVGALGNSVQVLGNDTAQVQFNVGPGTGNITIEAAATGIVLTLLNSLEVAVQRFDSGTWTTVYDSSQAQYANLLTIGASGITFKVDNLPEGTYRVLSYNTNLLATGSLTSLDVAVEQVGPGVVTGETSHQGNVITDIDPSGGQDTAPAGTVVTSVTNAQGQVLAVGTGGADINGVYGTLHINQNGTYTYTLNNTTAAVLGHTENFSYTITQNGISDTAQLVVTLGNGAPASSVTATDNTAALTYNTDVEAVNHGASQQSGFSVVSVGLGNVLNANVLANMANPIIFDVDDGSTRTMTLQASVGGVALLSTFDLYVYKFNETIQQYEQYKVVNTWLTAPLLGGTSGQLTLTLPGGEYLFLLNNATGVTALTGYTLNILQDHTYAVESVTATTNGNVLTDDVFTAGNTGHITQVNGVAVAASGTTTIVGEYGTLTIDAAGNYTYKLNSGVGADSIKTPDSFVYTVTSSNGDIDSASLNITATPHTVDAFNDISGVMAVNTAQTTAAYSDTTVGNATWTTSLLFATHGDGSGTFVVGNNDVLHNPILHFNIASLLPLGGVSINWTLTDGAGITRTGTISGSAILGGSPTVDLSGMDLHSGTWTLSYTGNAGILAVGGITITPSVTGTTIDLDSYSTLAGNTVHGNIYDGTEASGAADQLGTVHTLLSITGFNGTTTTLNPLTDSSSTATIQGHYGALVMGLDGAYTYTLNAGVSPASMTTKETFTYTLNDQNGHSDTATLTINMNPQFVSTAQGDVINSSAYGDTLVYHLLNSANATGGNGADTWKDFHMADGDKINIHDLLTGWNPATSNIANYLSVSYNGTSTVISIDRDGTAATHSSTQLVTLENTHVTLDELVQQNHIIT